MRITYFLINFEGLRETIKLNIADIIDYSLPIMIYTEMINNCDKSLNERGLHGKLFDTYFKITYVIFLLGSRTDTESIMWMSNVPKDVI